MKVEFFRHNLSDDDIKRVERILHGVILTTGEEVKDFERRFASYLDVSHVIGLTSCTAALHLSLIACGVGPGDEVITTPMTFIATINAIEYVGAIPVFVDTEPDTALIDPARIERAITKKTKAIIPVHLYGQMCDMEVIRRIADSHGLKVIEDSAHAIESGCGEIKPGRLGDVACFSFYATKNITSGEGGAAVTNSEEIAEKLRLLRLHGMSASAADRYNSKFRHWDMETLGWKYNMTNIQAAMLIGQLERIEERLQRREEIAQRYERVFSDLEGVDFPVTCGGHKSARHLFTIWVESSKRDDILLRLQERGIGVAVNYRSVHLLKFYREKYKFNRGSFPNAERIGDSTISIPLYPGLKDEEVEYVIDTVSSVVES